VRRIRREKKERFDDERVSFHEGEKRNYLGK
jgi:hypothetical protein